MEAGDRNRTYGIWGLVGLFTALAVVGLLLLLVVGSPSGDTTRVQTPQTVPEREAPTPAGGDD